MSATRPNLQAVIDIGSRDSYLAVVSTVGASGAPQASLVNAGVMAHPVMGESVVAFVTFGATKLRNIRARPAVTVTWRAGWEWVSVNGTAHIIGPDDPFGGFAAEELPDLLRRVFSAAGGNHSDWAEYDRVMVEQRRSAVFVTPVSVYSNPTGRRPDRGRAGPAPSTE